MKPHFESSSAADDNAANSVSSDALNIFALRACGVATGFLASLVLSRSVGAAGRGSLDVAGQTVALLVMLGGWSLGPGLTQLTARHRSVPRGLMGLGAILTLATATFAAILGQTAVQPAIRAGLLPVDAATNGFWRIFVPVSVVVAGFSVLVRSALMGLDRIVATTRADLCLKISTLGAFAALAFSGLHEPELYALAGLVGAGALLLWLYRDFRSRGRLGIGEWRSVVRPCLAMHLINGLHFLTLRADVFFIQAQHGAREVGVYTLGVSFGQIVLLASGAIAQPLLVEISRPGAGALESARATARALRGYWLLSGAVALGLAALAPVIPFVFGLSFAGSVVPLWTLLPGVIAFGGLNVITSHLFAQDRRFWNLALAVTGGVLTVLGNLTLTPKFGAIGAAASSSLSYLATGLLALIALRGDADCSFGEMLRVRWSDLRELMFAVRRLRP